MCTILCQNEADDVTKVQERIDYANTAARGKEQQAGKERHRKARSRGLDYAEVRPERAGRALAALRCALASLGV